MTLKITSKLPKLPSQLWAIWRTIWTMSGHAHQQRFSHAFQQITENQIILLFYSGWGMLIVTTGRIKINIGDFCCLNKFLHHFCMFLCHVITLVYLQELCMTETEWLLCHVWPVFCKSVLKRKFPDCNYSHVTSCWILSESFWIFLSQYLNNSEWIQTDSDFSLLLCTNLNKSA